MQLTLNIIILVQIHYKTCFFLLILRGKLLVVFLLDRFFRRAIQSYQVALGDNMVSLNLHDLFQINFLHLIELKSHVLLFLHLVVVAGFVAQIDKALSDGEGQVGIHARSCSTICIIIWVYLKLIGLDATFVKGMTFASAAEDVFIRLV